MTSFKVFECAPPLLSIDPMTVRTAKAVEALVEKAPIGSCLQFSVFKDGEKRMGLGKPTLQLKGVDPFACPSLSNHRGSEYEAELQAAIMEVMMDLQIPLAAAQMQNASNLKIEMGYLHLLVMPNVLRLSHPNPKRKGNLYLSKLIEWTEFRMGKMPTGRAQNFGVYAAGHHDSAHAKMAALGHLRSAGPIWQAVHDNFNRHWRAEGYAGTINLVDPQPGDTFTFKEIL